MEEENPFIRWFILFVIGFILVIVYQNQTSEYLTVRSTEDNESYLVQKGPDAQDAANMLSRLKKSLIQLNRHLLLTYPKDERSVQLNELFHPDSIIEAELDSDSTSYTINKGEKVVICLRARDGTNRIEQYNILIFVALHELSHILTESIGHTGEFWENFAWVLREAVKTGVWKYQDFTVNPVTYCGVKITSCPLTRDEAEKAHLSATFAPNS